MNNKNKTEFRKEEICLINDFQEFGEVLFLLKKRLLTNVKGEPLSNPIWEGIIIDAKNKRLRDIWHNRISEGTYFLALSFEKNLIKLSDNSKTLTNANPTEDLIGIKRNLKRGLTR